MLTRVAPIGAIAAAWLVMLGVPAVHHTSVSLPGWCVMVIAMMVPTILRPLRKVAGDDPRRAAVFLASYCAVWIAAAVPVVLLPVDRMSSFLVGVLWITTGIVQILPSTMRALHSCRSLAAADNAGIAGLRQGVWCVQACWLFMVATIVTASALPQVPAIGVMIIATVLMLAEKSRHTSPKMVRALGIVFIAVGALTIVVAPGLHVHV